MLTDALQAPHNIGQMRAEDSAVGVYLIDHNVAQVSKESVPPRVLREHALMQHIGVRENDIAAIAYLAA